MGDFSGLHGVIAQTAERQWGHVTRAQLLALGVGSSTIGDWIDSGRLVRVHAGVYAVGYRRVEPVALAMAAVLAGGPTAVVSHDTAAALWGLRRWPRQPEITIIGDRRPRRITAHRSTTLTRADTTVQLGVPTTTAARTLRDLKSRLTTNRFVRLVNQARLNHHLDAISADALLRGERAATADPTRSGLEDDFLRWLRRHHLPIPQTNARTPPATRSTPTTPRSA